MSDTSLTESIVPGKAGNIEGFNINTDPTNTIDQKATPKFAVDVIMALLKNRNTWDKDTYAKLAQIITSHVTNTTNPHGVTLSQILERDGTEWLYERWIADGHKGTIEEFKNILFKEGRYATDDEIASGEGDGLITVSQATQMLDRHIDDMEAHNELFESYFPGEPPPVESLWSLRSEFGDKLALTLQGTNTYVLPQPNLILRPSVQDELPINHADPIAFELWSSSIRNLCAQSDIYLNTGHSVTGGTVTRENLVYSPMDSYTGCTHVKGNTTDPQHYISMPISLVNGKEYNTSCYVYFHEKAGYVHLQVSAQIYATFEILTKTCVTAAKCRATIEESGNGWYRLSVQYLATANSTEYFRVKYATNKDITASNYLSRVNVLFSMFGAQHSDYPTLAPYIETKGSVVALSTTALKTKKPINARQGTFYFSIRRAMSLNPTSSLDDPIFVSKDFRIALSANAVKVKHLTTTYNYVVSESDENRFNIGVVYSPTKTLIQANGKQILAFPALYTGSLGLSTADYHLLGPVNGGLLEASFYDYVASEENLSFLTQL